LRLAEITIKDNVLHIFLQFPFHIKRVNEPASIELITSTLKSITNKEFTIIVEKMSKDIEKAKRPTSLEDQSTADDKTLMNDPLSIVKNVFGNAEVL
jgi:hypothetical protein